MEQVTEANGRDSADDTSAPPAVDAEGPSASSTAEDGEGGGCQALARGLSAMLGGVIKDFDSKAQDALRSQDELSGSLDRLIQELDQLLENAPLPFIVHHASRISSVKQRVSALNLVLKSIQRRIDNIDQMLSVGMSHEKTAFESN